MRELNARSLKAVNWIRVSSNFVAFIPVRWKCQMLANFSGVYFLGTALKFTKTKKNSSSLVYVLYNINVQFGIFMCSDGKEMYKKAWCTCKVVFFLSKPIAFLTFSLASPSSLLKLPLKFLTMPDSEDELCTSCLLHSGYFHDVNFWFCSYGKAFDLYKSHNGSWFKKRLESLIKNW